METIKNDESLKKKLNQSEKQSIEAICKALKAIDSKTTLDVYLFEKQKLDNPEEQLRYLTDEIHHEVLLWEPDRKVMAKYIPFVKYFIDDRFDSYRFKSCDFFNDSDGSNGNLLMESVSRGKKVNFINRTYTWEEVVWVTFVPFEFDSLPSWYFLVRFNNEWVDGQKLRDYIAAIGKKLEELGAHPKYGLLDKTLQTRKDKVRSTYRKYKLISAAIFIGGLIIAILLLKALS